MLSQAITVAMTFTHRTLFVVCLCLLGVVFGCTSSKSDQPQSPAPMDAESALEAGIVFAEGFSPQTFSGMTEPTQPASAVGADCDGYIPASPAQSFTATEDVPIRIHLESPEPTVLIITGPKEVHCDDYNTSSAPSIGRMWAAGTYHIYIGTPEMSDGATLYQLDFDHYDPRPQR